MTDDKGPKSRMKLFNEGRRREVMGLPPREQQLFKCVCGLFYRRTQECSKCGKCPGCCECEGETHGDPG